VAVVMDHAADGGDGMATQTRPFNRTKQSLEEDEVKSIGR